MTLRDRVERIRASIDVRSLPAERLRMLNVGHLTPAQIRALDVTKLTDEQLSMIDFTMLTDGQLEALAARADEWDEDTRKWFESLSDEELDAVAKGKLRPPQPQTVRESVASKVVDRRIESVLAQLRTVMSDEEIEVLMKETLDEVLRGIRHEAERHKAERENRADRTGGV